MKMGWKLAGFMLLKHASDSNGGAFSDFKQLFPFLSKLFSLTVF
jgi:hypothetical protein